MAYCLPKFAADVFKQKLVSGEINPDKLASLTSEERNSFFSSFLGEANAKNVNTLFESKLLLKNQQSGMIEWAKTVGGMKPEALRDFVDRVNKMTEVLNPTNKQSFLEDLAAHKLGIKTVSLEEATKITQLAEKVAEAKKAMEGGPRRVDGVATESELAYGKLRTEFSNYVADLKLKANQMTIMERLQPQNLGQNVVDLAGTTKALKASFDNSAIGRQGWKVMMTNPKIWMENSVKSFADLANQIGDKPVMDLVNADIVSRPNYSLMQKAKLAVGTLEEAYPTHILEKVPVLGRLYKASQTAYEAFMYRTRADLFDKYIDIAQKSGVDISDKVQLESIGRMVNSLTGRGQLGAAEKVAVPLNNIFFSPRNLMSHIDILTAAQFQKGVTPFVRKQAAINLLKIIGGTALVLGGAKAFIPDSVEFDPRSADFGKIKIGDTRFDVSGGMASVITLAARLITNSSKSSTTKKITELNSGKYGSQTKADVLLNFTMNKLSPLAAIIRDNWITGRDFQGNKPTVGSNLKNLLAPLPYTNYEELKNNPNSAPMLVAMIADALGIGTNTYRKK